MEAKTRTRPDNCALTFAKSQLYQKEEKEHTHAPLHILVSKHDPVRPELTM